MAAVIPLLLFCENCVWSDRACAAMKAPVGLLSGRAVCATADGGALPRQAPQSATNAKIKFPLLSSERSGDDFKSFCPSCNLVTFMVQYSSIQKNVSDSACCVVRHTDAGPVRWIRCEPGQVGNQAALSSAFVRFSQPASVCRVTQGGDKTPSCAVLFILPERGEDHVSRLIPQVETPAL